MSSVGSHRVEVGHFTFRGERVPPGGGNRERTAWMSRRLEELLKGLAREVGGRGGPECLEPPLQHEDCVLQQQLRDLSKILRSTALSSTSLLRTFHKLVLRTEMFLQQLSELQSASRSGNKDDKVNNDDDDVDMEDNEDNNDSEEKDEEGEAVDEGDAQSEERVGSGGKEQTRTALSLERKTLEAGAEDKNSDMELCDSPPAPERPGLEGKDEPWGKDGVRLTEQERQRCWQQEREQERERCWQKERDTAWTEEADDAFREATWMTSVLQFQFIADCAVTRHQELMEAVDEYRRFQELGEFDPLLGEVLHQHDRVLDLAVRQVTPLSTLVTDLCDLDAKVEELCRILHSRSRLEREKDEQKAEQWKNETRSHDERRCKTKGKGVGKHSMATCSEQSP